MDIFIIWCYLSAFGLWSFYRYSLSSADKMEKGKDLFECQIHDNKLFWSEVAAIFNSRKQASTYTT